MGSTEFIMPTLKSLLMLQQQKEERWLEEIQHRK
jgi:hypothetical protein